MSFGVAGLGWTRNTKHYRKFINLKTPWSWKKEQKKPHPDAARTTSYDVNGKHQTGNDSPSFTRGSGWKLPEDLVELKLRISRSKPRVKQEVNPRKLSPLAAHSSKTLTKGPSHSRFHAFNHSRFTFWFCFKCKKKRKGNPSERHHEAKNFLLLCDCKRLE